MTDHVSRSVCPICGVETPDGRRAKTLEVENAALLKALRVEWEAAHMEHCSRNPHVRGEDCRYPPPPELARRLPMPDPSLSNPKRGGGPMAETTEADKERARTDLEDAVYRAINAGMTHAEIVEEVRYTLENCEDD